MIYYVKYRDQYCLVTNLKGDIEDYLVREDWNLEIYSGDLARSVSLTKLDLDGPLIYTRAIDDPNFGLDVPVNMDELNLKTNDEFNLSIENARITILKLNQYLNNINEYVCVK